jgi:hypothetical protein
VKTLLTRTLPLLLSIALGAVLSWVSIYVFWFAIWTFHSVPIANACGAIGDFLLLPARFFYEWVGGDQTTVFYDPISYSVTNGLVLGIIFYCIFRVWWDGREAARQTRALDANGAPQPGRTPAAKDV